MGQSTESLNIALIGAGNLATNLGLALLRAGHNIVYVYSRTEQSACTLATRLGCPWTTSIQEAAERSRDCHAVILSVKDTALDTLANQLPQHSPTLFLHTAGSMPMDILPMSHRGVLYPMQTFSKEREADFTTIPTFLEVADECDRPMLEALSQSITHHTHWLSSERRKSLHLAAVFACNFSNYCYDVSSQLLDQNGIPFDVMLPLIAETTAKLQQLTPYDAQTGPAVRYDTNVINRHLEMLSETPDFQLLYKQISQFIHLRHTSGSSSHPTPLPLQKEQGHESTLQEGQICESALQKIRAIIFDIDGVLSTSTIQMDSDGQPIRSLNIKDGYAIQLAVKRGLRLAIITGGKTENVRLRYEGLGVQDIHIGVSMKLGVYEDFKQKYGLKDEEIIYVGDDIPDYEIMLRCGLPCCPADAAQEIKGISHYISPFTGGQGCGRDIIEQVLKAQGKWIMDKTAFGW